MIPANDDFDEALGFRLKKLRQSRRMSQEELGLMLGVSFQQIQKYESGTSCMPPERIAKCANIFEVSVGYFLGIDTSATMASFDKRVLTLATAIAKLPSEELQKKVYNLVLEMGETFGNQPQRE